MEDLNLYGKISEHIEKRDVGQPNEEEDYIEISEMPMFNEAILTDRLSKLDKLNDDELSKIIEDNYSRILENTFEMNDGLYLSLFLDERFLTMFINIVGNHRDLSDTDRILCNKIAYDYLTHDELKNIKPKFKGLFFNLSKRVNFKSIPKLLSIGLPEDIASHLALSRYSHINPRVYIRRLNHIIVSSPDSIMNEQMIINIYSILATRFTHLFKYTMFDVSTEEELNAIGPGTADIYATISLAMVDIMNDLTSVDIEKVLSEYANEYNTSDDLEVRFSMRSISESDYSRILRVIDKLEYRQTPVP